MGMFGRIRGGKTTLSVAAQPAEATPGGTVVVQYDVGGELDDQCSAIRAGVTCVGKYIVEEPGRDANGHPITREVWHEIAIHDDEQRCPVQLGSGTAEFTLPADAPIASSGAVEWTAWASIDRQNGSNQIERCPLGVRATAAAPSVLPDVASNGLTIHGAPDSARAGESVSGTLTVNVAEDIKAAVAVRLLRRCTYVADAVSDAPGGPLLVDRVTTSGGVCVVHQDEVATARSSLDGRSWPAKQSRRPSASRCPATPGRAPATRMRRWTGASKPCSTGDSARTSTCWSHLSSSSRLPRDRAATRPVVARRPRGGPNGQRDRRPERGGAAGPEPSSYPSG